VLERSLDLSFFMTNVTNNTYVTGVFPIYVQFGFESLTYSAPRMYGFNLRWRFGPGLNSGI
jgi:outer membrane receptor protein involved in Fe transport